MTQLSQALERPTVPTYTPHLRSHIKAAADHLHNDSEEMRQCSPEQVLYHAYMQAGAPHGPVLYAVKGEHWNGVSPKFLEFINAFQFERSDMGYAESGYGIQRHRNFMRRLIVNEHHLGQRKPAAGLDIDVGCLAMTTRMAMYDMAKVALRHSKEQFPGKTPVALVPTPSWDYRGIFKDVGFEIVFLPLGPKNGWLPDLGEWDRIVRATLADGNRRIAMTVSNPQHNPTGMQWPVEVTQYLLALVADQGGHLLLDDAYYCVHDPRVPVVNHLKAVLDAFDVNGGDNDLVRSGMFGRWVATRPFGKQFSCNTMGVAAITTSPTMLRQLSRESWINRYHTNTHNAELMCAWLATPEAADWTIETGLFYTRQKDLVRTCLLERMGWQAAGICAGPSTSYMLIEIPPVYQQTDGGIDRFRDDLFFATGTLVSASLFNQTAQVPFVRLHLGSHPEVIEEFLRRWEAAGLRYDMPKTFGGKEALARPVAPPVFRQEA
ncbi:aminotransferase class I/II-fold pyridoxal phosphate-dependent enzyme [Massilia sp. YIM B02763]|uniref:aminotransferase class I/II-fold pyridoxal phosphate-dependent enzyme n=1 Tax=Massilia sp. YIM B02763 TaxID=3050130 RepID=UPI0025B68720|nr:aminotransferase class I/II-fold pyridoxal phosphate-dependent enzyme [Massilia sp. YIM B02763]MDN4055878.1 aminotransferase class I/II-fold pyridoxal phosphate-dependent enzyme [Massilia sp. YIM B02763]